MLKNNKELFICDCHSTDHQMIVLKEMDEDNPIMYMHVHLVKRPFWQRLKYGLKYIFGYQCRYGAFDEFIFNPEDRKRFKQISKHLKTKK